MHAFSDIYFKLYLPPLTNNFAQKAGPKLFKASRVGQIYSRLFKNYQNHYRFYIIHRIKWDR